VRKCKPKNPRKRVSPARILDFSDPACLYRPTPTQAVVFIFRLVS